MMVSKTCENRECVSGDTRVHTLNGCYKIRDLVGKNVFIFNGVNWSEVKPFLCKEEDELMKITFSDGSEVTVTPNFNFLISSDGINYKKSKASELKLGLYLPKFRLISPGCEQIIIEAYDKGKFQGKSEFCNFKSSSLMIDCNCQEVDEIGLEVMTSDIDSIYQFVAGWADACYEERMERYIKKKEDGVYLFGRYKILHDLQILLRRVNINNAEIYKHSLNKNFAFLRISKNESKRIPTRVLPIIENNISSSLESYQSITGIMLVPNGPSYSFLEKTMGVFGNVLI